MRFSQKSEIYALNYAEHMAPLPSLNACRTFLNACRTFPVKLCRLLVHFYFTYCMVVPVKLPVKLGQKSLTACWWVGVLTPYSYGLFASVTVGIEYQTLHTKELAGRESGPLDRYNRRAEQASKRDEQKQQKRVHKKSCNTFQ